MKNLFLTLAFLLIGTAFFASNGVNSKDVSNFDLSNTTIISVTPNIINLENPPVDEYACFQAAYNASEGLGYAYGFSDLEIYHIFNQVYDDCVENHQQK